MVGDAAGLCGAFAADGIKGAVVSGKVAAQIFPKFLKTVNHGVFKSYKQEINKFDKLMEYFYKQLIFRWVWNRIKRDSTFFSIINLISRNKKTFISKFSDAKAGKKSLLTIIFNLESIPYIIIFGLLWLRDLIFPFRVQKD